MPRGLGRRLALIAATRRRQRPGLAVGRRPPLGRGTARRPGSAWRSDRRSGGGRTALDLIDRRVGQRPTDGVPAVSELSRCAR